MTRRLSECRRNAATSRGDLPGGTQLRRPVARLKDRTVRVDWTNHGWAISRTGRRIGRMTADLGAPAAVPTGIHHVRLTVTDIARSRMFYTQVFGSPPAVDFSEQAGDPEVRADRGRLFGGCVFVFGQQIVGLRPAAPAGDRFDASRVGLDHISLTVASLAALESAA